MGRVRGATLGFISTQSMSFACKARTGKRASDIGRGMIHRDDAQREHRPGTATLARRVPRSARDADGSPLSRYHSYLGVLGGLRPAGRWAGWVEGEALHRAGYAPFSG